jgi:Gluconate 2-dehydrogenase subunit 3
MITPMPEQKSAKLLAGRFPDYDVLSKRQTPSWNDKTREVIAHRLAVGPDPKFFTADEFKTVEALAARIVPQPSSRSAIPVAALVDEKLHLGMQDGYRQAGMPRDDEAWRRGLKALDSEAQLAHGARFRDLSPYNQDLLLARMEKGELAAAEWGSMQPKVFFQNRLARDLVLAYYSHPTAWNEIGWGGPASPRGYVRMDFNERDPWEAAEVSDGDVETARRKNRRVGSI